MNSNQVAPLASYNTVHAFSKLCEHELLIQNYVFKMKITIKM